MYFKIVYVGKFLATCLIEDLTIDFLESLFDQFDGEYGLSDSYRDAAEWVAELVLAPVYVG